MASSKPTNIGQVPVCCHICNTEANIKWKCLDCDFFMCTNCKDNIHVKFKLARDHKIVDIRQAGALIREDYIPWLSVSCQKHGKTCCMFCQSCDQLVCTTCISQTHNGHGLVEIQEGYIFKVGKIKKEKNFAKTKLNKLNREEKRISEIKNVENKKFLETKESIRKQNKALKLKIDQYTDNLIKELDEKWEKIHNDIETETRRILKKKEELEKQISKSENIIISKDISEIFQEIPTIIKSVEEDIIGEPVKFDSIPKFVPGQMTEYNVGSLEEIGNDISLNMIKQYTTNISDVFSLSTNEDGSLWIANMDTIQRVKPEGDDLKVVRSIDVLICGMAQSPTGDILLATGESQLKQINNQTGELTVTKYSVDPLISSTVYVTKDRRIIVGAREHGEPYEGRTAVIIMDDDGRHDRRYETDHNNQQIFTCVESITSTSTGNVFVVDILSSDGRGRVVLLGQDGDILNMYTGYPDLNTEKHPFKPVTVFTTSADNIIVPNLKYNILHILNCVGDLITNYDTTNIGINSPYSLGLTKTGKWYIGCSTDKGSTDNAKLYEVAINGM